MNFRPFSNEELRNNAPQVVTCNDYQREVAVSQNIAGKHIDRVFTFDKVGFPHNQGFAKSRLCSNVNENGVSSRLYNL